MMHFDRWGLLGQIQPDGSIEGGDAACFTGHWLYLARPQNWGRYSAKFEIHWGAYVRHPDPSTSKDGWASFYKNPWTGVISRDQLTGVLAGLMSQGERSAIFRAWLHHGLSLWLFSYNRVVNGRNPKLGAFKLIGDLTGPDIWALYIRGLNWAILWPLLVVLDLHLVLNSIVLNCTPKNDDNINSLMKLFISQDRLSTPTAWLARRLVNKQLMIDKMERYWCGWRDNCFMFPLYKQRIERL